MADTKRIERFTFKGGKAFDGGVPVSGPEIDQFISRQQRAIDNNNQMLDGPLDGVAKKANELLQQEIENAKKIRMKLGPQTILDQPSVMDAMG